MFDVVIIGAGVVGSAIARALSKYDLQVCVLEKEADVALGASKANSGIIHGGYAGKAGTLKGDLCLRGNRMYDQLEAELNFGFKRIGGMILGFDEGDRPALEAIVENGHRVGQRDFQWLNQEAVRQKEPAINPEVEFALFVPSIGVASPYELTIALMENAIHNGVTLKLNHEVKNIVYDSHYLMQTSQGIIESHSVINAAGIDSARLNGFFDDGLKIQGRRGQYILFGKDQAHLVNHVLFQPPSNKGKGILVTTTYHGNFMIGPDAEDLTEDMTTETSLDRLQYVIDQARRSIPSFQLKRALTTFSGIRAMASNQDFYIKAVRPGFITVGGIDSPGLTSAPAIGDHVVNLLKKEMTLSEKSFDPYRPSYYLEGDDTLVCFCEEKTTKMLEECFNRPIPITTTDAVKRRIRAGMGNCQGTRCLPIIQSSIEKATGLKNVRKRTEETMPVRVDIRTIRGMN